jgi:hypothetical protein
MVRPSDTEVSELEDEPEGEELRRLHIGDPCATKTAGGGRTVLRINSSDMFEMKGAFVARRTVAKAGSMMMALECGTFSSN